MNNRPNNPAKVQGKGEMENKKRKMEPDKLIEFAREYFAADFPNPDRRGCPDRATLDSLARSGRLPDDDLRAHLFGCSDCFNEYRTALAERPQMSPVISRKESWQDRWRAAWTPIIRPSLAWASAAALVIALAVWTTRRAEPEAPSQNIAQHRSQAGASSPAPALSDPAPTPQIASTVESLAPQPRLIMKRRKAVPAVEATVSVDLNEYVAMRDVKGTNRFIQPAITLQAVRTRLKLNFPEGSLAGTYNVSLLDEFDIAIVANTATSRDGKKLVTVLDLRGVRPKSYQLSLEHQEEWSESYSVVVVKPKRSDQR